MSSEGVQVQGRSPGRLDHHVDQALVCHNNFARLTAFQVLLHLFACQCSRSDRLLACVRRDDNPVTYLAVDLDRDLDLSSFAAASSTSGQGCWWME